MTLLWTFAVCLVVLAAALALVVLLVEPRAALPAALSGVCAAVAVAFGAVAIVFCLVAWVCARLAGLSAADLQVCADRYKEVRAEVDSERARERRALAIKEAREEAERQKEWEEWWRRVEDEDLPAASIALFIVWVVWFLFFEAW